MKEPDTITINLEELPLHHEISLYKGICQERGRSARKVRQRYRVSNQSMPTMDILQEAFIRLKVWKRIFKGKRALAGAMNGMIRNVVVDHIRSREAKKRPPKNLQHSLDQENDVWYEDFKIKRPDEETICKVESDIISRIIKKIGARRLEWANMLMLVRQGLTPSEAGIKLGFSKSHGRRLFREAQDEFIKTARALGVLDELRQ